MEKSGRKGKKQYGHDLRLAQPMCSSVMIMINLNYYIHFFALIFKFCFFCYVMSKITIQKEYLFTKTEHLLCNNLKYFDAYYVYTFSSSSIIRSCSEN